MAAVDLYGADAQKLKGAYSQHLGRDASDDELTGWLSGSYGGGTVDNWLQQISQSHEAQAKKTSAGSQGPNVVGQPDPNVSTTMPVASQQPYQNLDWWAQQGVGNDQIANFATGQLQPGWQRTGSGYERTPAPQGGNYQSWFQSRMGGGPSSPEALAAMEAELNKYGIRLQKDSAGTIRGRMYLPDGSAVDVVNPNGWGQPWTWINRGTGGGSGGGGGFSPLSSSQYSDPHTRQLEQMMLQRIQSLMGGQDPGLQQLLSYLQQRFNDLQGPGRTGAENEIIRTQALDPIEQDRTAAKKRMLEQISARGFTPDSGVAQQLLAEVDKAYDGMRAMAQTTMGVDELNRREGRNQRAESLAGSIYELPQARQREALGYAGALSDLGPQRLQLAMQASGMGGSPYSMFNSLMQMAQMNQNSALLDQRNSSQLWSGLGELAYMLMNSGR